MWPFYLSRNILRPQIEEKKNLLFLKKKTKKANVFYSIFLEFFLVNQFFLKLHLPMLFLDLKFILVCLRLIWEILSQISNQIASLWSCWMSLLIDTKDPIKKKTVECPQLVLDRSFPTHLPVFYPFGILVSQAGLVCRKRSHYSTM